MSSTTSRSRLGLAVCGLLIASLWQPAPGSARQATPAANVEATACDVAARPVEELLALTESMAGESLAAYPLPAGEAADRETTEEIAATLKEMGACLTGGEMLRFYALHSDNWLREFSAEVDNLTMLTASARPLDDGDRAVYLGPWHVEMLPDGRVLAATLLRVGNEPRPDPMRARVLLFVQRDGRWLVDETISHVRLPDCAAPVEVAAVVGPPPGAMFDAWTPSCDG